MADKGSNHFNECETECVHLYPQEEECTSCSWEESKMYTPGTIRNSQRTRSKINENGVIGKVRVSGEQVILKDI